MVLNGILRFVFSSENGSERNSKVFLVFQKWFRTEFRGFSHPKMVQNGIPRVFLFREDGSERNSEVFLFHETGGIPMELPFVPSCSVFRGIIFVGKWQL
jgi:hypothetical protein